MNSSTQIRLLNAVAMCLRPIARMLLRSGIGYRQFAELAKTAFITEALGERDSRGRTTNLSRVAVRTGLSRKEVARLRARLDSSVTKPGVGNDSAYHSGNAARVLQLWHADQRFLEPSGLPMRLPFSGNGRSFSSLVRAAGGDVPPGAVRAELTEALSIAEDEAGYLRPLKRYFVPADVGEELVVGFTHIVLPVLAGLARNTDRGSGEPFIQRLAYSDRLIPSAVPLFRTIARRRASEFVQSVDDWLNANELSPDDGSEPSERVGMGVFYYEGPTPAETRVPSGPPPEIENGRSPAPSK
jgi:Family of unknown function (DUF6502)